MLPKLILLAPSLPADCADPPLELILPLPSALVLAQDYSPPMISKLILLAPSWTKWHHASLPGPHLALILPLPIALVLAQVHCPRRTSKLILLAPSWTKWHHASLQGLHLAKSLPLLIALVLGQEHCPRRKPALILLAPSWTKWHHASLQGPLILQGRREGPILQGLYQAQDRRLVNAGDDGSYFQCCAQILRAQVALHARSQSIQRVPSENCQAIQLVLLCQASTLLACLPQGCLSLRRDLEQVQEQGPARCLCRRR
jgi:hypothetical protein